MSLPDNLIFDAYQLYLTYFEAYTYKVKFKNPLTNEISEIELVNPKDRFPHLIGLSTIFPGESATDSITYLENNDSKYLISNLQSSFLPNFKLVKNKIIYFQHLSKLFTNVEFYKIHSIPNSKVTGSYIFLNIIDREEINLVLDLATSPDILGKYIPKSYLINYRTNCYGKFVSDSTIQELIRLDRITNSDNTIVNLFYDELKDKNNKYTVEGYFSSTNFPFDNFLVNSIITLNNTLSTYYTIENLINMKLLNNSAYLQNHNAIDEILNYFYLLMNPSNNTKDNSVKKDA